MQSLQIIKNTWQPKPLKNLASVPVKEGKTNIFGNEISWEDLRGLSWVLNEEADYI